MIQISVHKHNDRIEEIKITGHANTADYGEDLVCAAVSAVAFGLCNALDIITKTENLSVSGNEILIQTDGLNEIEQIVLNTGLIQLQTIEEINKESVKIIQLEV